MVEDDKVSKARSRLMSRIRRSNTKPERIVRSMLHRLGYRYRIQYNKVPGRPDIAFPARRKAIQIYGCFWHQHPGCKHARIPVTRREFWEAKFERNRERDAHLLADAERQGWAVLTLWECGIVDAPSLEGELRHFLGSTRANLDLRALPKSYEPA